MIYLVTNQQSIFNSVGYSMASIEESLEYLETLDIYLWADYSCNYSNWRIFNPYLSFRLCADDTICSEVVI